MILHNRNRLPLLLEAEAAKYRSALCGPEGYCGFYATLRTGCPGFRTYSGISLSTLGFAHLAALGVIPELFIVKEQLLAGCEDKLCPAIDALDDAIGEFHSHFPESGP